MSLASPANAHAETPLVSVVVIGRNEGERLRRCLQSVHRMQRSFGIETICVDSSSTDNSVAMAREDGAQVVTLSHPHPTAARGRNAGWRIARGEFVLFLDGDTVLDPHFVKHSLSDFAQTEIAVVWGNRREMFPQASVYNRVFDLDWIHPPGPTLFCGGDAMMRRSVLMETGGYDESLIAGEEPELCRRIAARGYTILHVDRQMTAHDLAMTSWRQYWRRSVRTGHAYAEVSALLAARGESFWQIEARHNRRRAITLLAVAIFAVLLGVFLHAVWPMVLAMVFFAAISLRSAWKTRWKSKDVVTLLLYGIHSHLQQVPIFLGQLRYASHSRRNKASELVEYK